MSKREEWACYYYEFYREHRALREEVIAERKLPQDEQDSTLEMRTNFVCAEVWCGESNDEVASLVPYYCKDEFPKLPWQEISKDRRAAILKLLPNVQPRLRRPVRRDALLAHAAWINERAGKSDGIAGEFAVVPLDWSLDNKALIRRFEAILSHRPVGTKKTKKAGRKSPLDRLNALGVMRLKKHYAGISPLMKAINQRVVNLSYNDEAALRRVVRKCEAILENFGSGWE